jgi:hypothetical protein
MGYARIIIHLVDGTRRSGVRRFPEPMDLDAIRNQARQLASEVLGTRAIEDVVVSELPANDPAVVALILSEARRNEVVPRSDGEHPYVREQRRKPPR